MVTSAPAALLVAALVALTACVSQPLAEPRITMRTGRGAKQPVSAIVALTPTCGILASHMRDGNDGAVYAEPAKCEPAVLDGVGQEIRGALAFAGYQVIDAERVNAITSRHHEVIERFNAYGSRHIEQRGATFEDATPVEQAELLRELGADAVLTTRLWIGAGYGLSGRRMVAVQVRLASARDRQLVWARRCELQASGFESDEAALAAAARCTAKGMPRP
jgi:hypothetical protein